MATNPPPPPPPSGGPGEFLKTQIGPFPLWIWLVAGAGVAAFFLVPKLLGRSTSSPTSTTTGASQTSSQQATQAANQAQLASEGIDPLTGVPFSVENAINPNTGLPNYYNASIPGWYTPVTNQPQPPGSPPPVPPAMQQQTGTGPILLNPSDPNSLYLGYPMSDPGIPTPMTAPTYRYGGF